MRGLALMLPLRELAIVGDEDEDGPTDAVRLDPDGTTAAALHVAAQRGLVSHG